jgi:hypothetical protein
MACLLLSYTGKQMDIRLGNNIKYLKNQVNHISYTLLKAANLYVSYFKVISLYYYQTLHNGIRRTQYSHA